MIYYIESNWMGIITKVELCYYVYPDDLEKIHYGNFYTFGLFQTSDKIIAIKKSTILVIGHTIIQSMDVPSARVLKGI